MIKIKKGLFLVFIFSLQTYISISQDSQWQALNLGFGAHCSLPLDKTRVEPLPIAPNVSYDYVSFKFNTTYDFQMQILYKVYIKKILLVEAGIEYFRESTFSSGIIDSIKVYHPNDPNPMVETKGLDHDFLNSYGIGVKLNNFDINVGIKFHFYSFGKIKMIYLDGQTREIESSQDVEFKYRFIPFISLDYKLPFYECLSVGLSSQSRKNEFNYKYIDIMGSIKFNFIKLRKK